MVGFPLGLWIYLRDSGNVPEHFVVGADVKQWLVERSITDYSLEWRDVTNQAGYPPPVNRGRVYDTFIIFKKASDAILYKLTWGGRDADR